MLRFECIYLSTGLQVNDLGTDLGDGTKLVALVEALQKRTLRKIHSPNNQHQMLENVSRALDAISEDGVKLVNIGKLFLSPTFLLSL
jgi:filamin